MPYRSLPREVIRGPVLSLQVLDRSLAGRCEHGEPYAFISITVPNVPHPRLVECEACRGTLLLHFSDIDGPLSPTLPMPPSERLFNREMAEEIASFVRRHLAEGTSLIVVNCDAGVSRSAGVAAALSLHYNGDDSTFRREFSPNAWVRKLTGEALRAEARDG
jgi:predicted protein tyrosine phosphatase